MAYNDEVRSKLIEINNKGLTLKAIALNVGVDVNDLSRFKGGMECLEDRDVGVLSEYLDAVVIPQWNIIVKEERSEKKASTKLDVLRKRMKNNEEKPKRRKVSLDLLNELE